MLIKLDLKYSKVKFKMLDEYLRFIIIKIYHSLIINFNRIYLSFRLIISIHIRVYYEKTSENVENN